MELKKAIESGQNYLGRAVKNGFFHIFGGSTLTKCISALSSILIPLILTKSAYASIGYAEYLMGYLLLFNGLGISNAVLRYCAVFDSPEEKKSYFTYAVKFGVLIDIIFIAVVGIAMFILDKLHVFHIQYNSGYLLLSLALIPVFQLVFDCIQYFFRANRANKSFSKTSVIFTAFYGTSQIVLAFFFATKGIVIGRYIAYAATLLIAYMILKKMPAFNVKSHKISKNDKKNMLKYSANFMLANVFSQIMPINEAVILGFMVSSNDFADFKAASVLPASLQFITMSAIIFVFPYFAKNYKDGKYIMRNAKKLIIGLSVAMLIITVAGVLLSPEIVKIFGAKYKTGHATMLMQLFFVTFGINSAIRMPVGNILAAIGEVRFNVINAIFSSTVHLGICVLLIFNFGIFGAAYGLLSVYALGAVAAIIYLRYYCKKLEKKQSISSREIETLPDDQIEEIDP